MLCDELRDGAVSAAKASSHEEVELRHVWFAIAKRFRSNPKAESLFDAARRTLDPHGNAHRTPLVSADAEDLLQLTNTEADAIAVLVAALSGPRPAQPASAGGAAGQQSADPVSAEKVEAATTEPIRKVETVAEVLAELDALVGLSAVKAQVRQVVAVVHANAQRAKAGLKVVNPSLHLVFTGPPGTGKTTVARLVARLYAAAGALPGSAFVEASRADLIAGYVGQTALKTAQAIRSARPGVLFIDEAYALTPTHGTDFGAEAIATLVKAMEDHRDDLAVVAAGYGGEMEQFVASNPGLRSRFKTYIDFPGYSAAELLQIFELLAHDAKIGLGDGAREQAGKVFSEAVRHEDFGNARFARSLFEGAYARMAIRAAADGSVELGELTTLSPDDVVLDLDHLRRERRVIGFGRDRG